MVAQTSRARFDTFSLVALGAAGIIAGFAISALGGWALRIILHAQPIADMLPMAPSSAVAFVSLAVGVAGLALADEGRAVRNVTIAAIAVALSLTVIGFVEFATEQPLALNRWFAAAIGLPPGPEAVARQMPISTALTFMLTIPPLAIVLTGARPRVWMYLSQIAAVLVIGSGLFYTLGYAYGRPFVYEYADLAMSLPSALTFTVTGIGLIAMTLRHPILSHLAETEWVRQASAAKSEFLSRMSHELRTPLNAILGFGQLLEMEVERPADRESAQQIVKAGKHLLRLINDILDLAKIEAGRLPLSLESVVVREVAAEARDLVRHLAAEQNVTVEVIEPAESDSLCARADQQRLKQVLLNLLSNGIKFNTSGGSVTVSWSQVGSDRVRITVTDSAGGIPLALMPKLFAPFERLGASARGIEGSGLGLALSKDLVVAMGGSLGVESTPGVGSTFSIELPRAEASPPAASRETKSEAKIPDTGAEYRVLYIEDNLSNLRLVERLLAFRAAVKVESAVQGTIGLELARQIKPDLILLDVHLPDMDGLDVLRRLRLQPETRDVPIIMVSADATERQQERMLTAGAQDYLTKPIVIQEFLAAVDHHLFERAPE